jgi:hypothetical protein
MVSDGFEALIQLRSQRRMVREHRSGSLQPVPLPAIPLCQEAFCKQDKGQRRQRMGIGFGLFPSDVLLKVQSDLADVVKSTGKQCFDPQQLRKPQALCNFSAERCDLGQMSNQRDIGFSQEHTRRTVQFCFKLSQIPFSVIR